MRVFVAFALSIAVACTSSGGADSGAPPQCDGGNCSCSGSTCTCPSGAGCEFQCFVGCKVTCNGPCVVHCVNGPCDVKCGGAMPVTCAHDNFACNRNCPP